VGVADFESGQEGPGFAHLAINYTGKRRPKNQGF
jgi:hypothetical protein